MVRSDEDYVLQWSEHAAHVTERFRGLFARQALVDVTLICQGQKLRVHKLVLASCSPYFEEMLNQDLGQEPVILLRDLDFDVFKAMVEFMYCGETLIEHCNLANLLDAAHAFKVKELEYILLSMLRTENIFANASLEPEDNEGTISSSSSNRKRGWTNSRPSGVLCDEASMPELEENPMSECKGDQALENGANSSYAEDDVEHSLYETTSLATETTADCAKEEERESSDDSSDATLDSSDGETSKMCTSEDDDEALTNPEVVSPTGETDLKSIYDERCCNYSNDAVASPDNATTVNDKNSIQSQVDCQDAPSGVGECSKVYTHKKRKYPERDDYSRENVSVSPTESSSVEDSPDDDSDECPRAVKRLEKCLKVYTHKRRKSLDERKCSSSVRSYADSIKEPTSTSCIDLSDEASRDSPPVTLPATLDMETLEYIWSLNPESIQYVVGCTINQSSGLISGKEGTFSEGNVGVDFERTNDAPVNNKRVRHIKELFSVGNGNLDITTPPVLRRSVRINQLENDDSINNNGSAASALTKGRDKQTDIRSDDYSDNNGTVGKTKRKVNKETDSRVSDENNVTTTTNHNQNSRKNANNSRSLRSTSKLASRKSSGKTRCSIPRSDKEEQKSKSNGKVKKIESADCDIFIPTRLNTIASVDRALWGDMSDVLENREYGATLTADYSPSKEIPFAVGLLPLRAALERMQATLDHQPRKTRSSVAPFRQDLNSLKWKDAELLTAARKHNSNDGDVVAAANTVCHIQIRTSSQCTQNRRTSPSEQMVAVGSTSETNRR